MTAPSGRTHRVVQGRTGRGQEIGMLAGKVRNTNKAI